MLDMKIHSTGTQRGPSFFYPPSKNINPLKVSPFSTRNSSWNMSCEFHTCHGDWTHFFRWKNRGRRCHPIVGVLIGHLRIAVFSPLRRLGGLLKATWWFTQHFVFLGDRCGGKHTLFQTHDFDLEKQFPESFWKGNLEAMWWTKFGSVEQWNTEQLLMVKCMMHPQRNSLMREIFTDCLAPIFLLGAKEQRFSDTVDWKHEPTNLALEPWEIRFIKTSVCLKCFYCISKLFIFTCLPHSFLVEMMDRWPCFKGSTLGSRSTSVGLLKLSELPQKLDNELGRHFSQRKPFVMWNAGHLRDTEDTALTVCFGNNTATWPKKKTLQRWGFFWVAPGKGPSEEA